jgi:U3 small nucleolar RNA-associated protein 6
MLPELENLVNSGIFKKNEIKKIIKKRRYYEYQFERKDVSKFEFFKAIKYEKVLDRRRIQKRKELQIQKLNYNDFHCKNYVLIFS